MSGTAATLAIAAMRRQRGSSVTLRRTVLGGSPVDVTVIATVKEFQPNQLAGNVVQGDRWAKLSNDDIVAAAWPGPPRRGDQIIMDGRTFTALGCDTVKMGDAVLSHTMHIRGGS